jgi:AraC-like DNA-binding protein
VISQSYRERPPAPSLARYVTCVWTQVVEPGSAPYTHRTVPNGSADIACEIGATPRIVGPQTGPTAETLTGGTTVVGVRFRPGAVPAALGLPASELVDLVVGSEDLWGRAAAVELGEEVAASGAPAEALERAVAARMADADGLDPVALEAVGRLLPWRGHDVASLPSALYVSERQLRRRFEAAVGLAPKPLQRMLRFQGFLALTQAHDHTRGRLARLAAEAGYADQSHLTREAMRLAGRSPRVLLLEADEHCRSSHDHTASYGPLLQPRAAA